MEVRQCEFCRMPYQSLGSRICNDCLAKLDEEFIMIREYLYENEGAGMEEVAEATGVPKKSIMYLLKEERLTVGSDDGDGGGLLTCESCKRPIRTGRMCGSCKNQVIADMQENVAVVKRPKQRTEETEEVSIKAAAKLQLK